MGEIIHAEAITVVPNSDTTDGVSRIELTPRLAMINRKVYG